MIRFVIFTVLPFVVVISLFAFLSFMSNRIDKDIDN